jgi:hypothetical protein
MTTFPCFAGASAATSWQGEYGKEGARNVIFLTVDRSRIGLICARG